MRKDTINKDSRQAIAWARKHLNIEDRVFICLLKHLKSDSLAISKRKRSKDNK